MGPFYLYYDSDGAYEKANKNVHNSWYADYSYFLSLSMHWFYRGGHCSNGLTAGQFSFSRFAGVSEETISSRLVLAVK